MVEAVASAAFLASTDRRGLVCSRQCNQFASSSPRLPHSDGFRQSGFAEILLSVSHPLSNSDGVAEEIYRDAS
jgi:hypothetical protein